MTLARPLWLFACMGGLVGPLRAQSAEGPAADSAFRVLDGVLGFIRNRNLRDYAVATPAGIDEARYLRIGGIDQWVSVRGEDRRNPVLLLLHGGPGDATSPWGYAGLRSWIKRFTLVQWDQRGAGRTLGRNGVAAESTISIDRMTRDGVELADSLRRLLGKDQLLLVGHSWGSILGVLMVKARPDLFWAFVGTGQVADPGRNYHVAFDDLVRHAARVGEARAIEELRAVGPPPYPDGRGFGVQRRWSNLFEGADRFIGSMLGLAFGAPGTSVADVNDWIRGQMVSAERLVPATAVLDSTTLGGAFRVPMFVIQGALDFTTPTSLARDFVRRIQAPRKEFVAVANGGHFMAFAMPEAFLAELVGRVLPLAPGH